MLAYWKFESISLQRRVNELSVPLDEGVFASADGRRQTKLIARVEFVSLELSRSSWLITA